MLYNKKIYIIERQNFYSNIMYRKFKMLYSNSKVYHDDDDDSQHLNNNNKMCYSIPNNFGDV